MSELYIEFCFLSLLGLSLAGGSDMGVGGDDGAGVGVGGGGDDGTAASLSATSPPGVIAGISAGC